MFNIFILYMYIFLCEPEILTTNSVTEFVTVP